MTADKAEFRSVQRARRRSEASSRADDDGARLAASFAAQATAWLSSALASGNPAAPSVACYLSARLEPPTASLLQALHEQGCTVLVPVCLPGHRMEWVRWHPGIEVRRSALAPVDEPAGPGMDLQELLADGGPGLDAMFLPATAVDAAGNRLGQGGGYYDRFLEALAGTGRTVPLAALVFEAEFVPEGAFAVDPLDRAVDAVVTEQRYRFFAE